MAQRGATLTAYALIMSSMVAVSLGAVKGLDEGSTQVLEATGDSIGEARPTREELAESISEDDPDDGSIDGPDPGPTPTYSWQSDYTGIIETTGGFCVADVGGEPRTAACSTASTSSLEFFDNADDATDHVQLRTGGLCVTRIGSNQPVVLAACQDGNDDQMWLQTPSGNLANAGVPGQCLDIDSAAVGSPGATVYSWGCHGNANQTFTFPGPYVPPIVEVTSVPASSATLTGAFQLGSNGFISAPNGTGSSTGSPNPSRGTATFTFTVAQAGDYRISGQTIAPSGSDDSFWVSTSLDGNATNYEWGVRNSSSPSTDFVNTNNGSGADVVISIPAGTTLTVVVTVREDGTSLGGLTLVPVG